MLSHRASFILAAALLVVLCVVGAVIASIAPSDWNAAGTTVSIPVGANLSQTAGILKADGVIRSTFAYEAYATILGGRESVKAGQYLFSQPESALRAAYRTVNGDFGLPPIKVTIFEGSDTADMARIFKKAIPGFDAALFLALAKPREGYLFPDTYFFTSMDTPVTVIKAMTVNFNRQEASIASKIVLSGRKESDIIKMASIVEKEATSSADRRMVAGVLWKRIDAGMPLQVDPPFYYILNKTTALTQADLATVSPYNLYLNKGLPPTPIDSPGLDAILDTVSPTASKYWFYISDSHGAMHYASTLAEHNANIAKYLN
jgi:UPF0755 protein